jgi:cation diffusion facilitator CzcD-associated flavoprotein CzcO
VQHVDVLVVGAGLSGIAAAHYVQDRCPWASYAVFEARDAIGGTWDLFRYPGIRSDSDMFTLGYSFRPWTRDRSIAEGGDILDYIRATAAAEGIDRHIRFGHRVERADWSTEDGRWHVTARRTDTDETFTFTCGWLFSCAGYYRYDHGYLPEFTDMGRYDGTVVHPQHWPEGLDVTDRQVVVIGSGATAVTLVPALARTAGHVTMLQRSPTYIASVPAVNPATRALRRLLPARLAGPVLRWVMALGTQALYQVSKWRPEVVKRGIRKGLERELPPGYDIDTHFTPTYDPWDQRLCVVPDGDLFTAIREGRASVVTDHVERFTPTGIALRSGRHLDADVVVTATGLELLFLGGIELSVDGEKVDPGQHLTYKGMMLEGVPNLSIAIGYTNASWTLKAELTCEVTTRILNHLRVHGVRQCTPVGEGGDPGTEPLLGLTSGYIARSADRFPKQGARSPWRIHQNYVRDYRELKLAGVDDGVLRFSNPIPTAVTAAAGTP